MPTLFPALNAALEAASMGERRGEAEPKRQNLPLAVDIAEAAERLGTGDEALPATARRLARDHPEANVSAGLIEEVLRHETKTGRTNG